ncbi:MAG: O-antigen ligase family protein [Candidatus Omnitrophica bacterium]|nr:O-antigen ligase family protein [Candidatus Omnitrophota bacterium]
MAIITMIVFWLRGNWKFILIGPIFAHIIWLSGYKLRAAGDFERLFSLTGREMTWSQGIDLVVTSPIYGLGFQADRLMLEFQHMHNAYLQALIQGGILGFIFFTGAILLAWKMIFPYLFLNRLKRIPENQRPLAIESIAMIGFLTARSFVESTGAFFGIDLLILLPHICYLQLLLKEPNNKEKEAVSI